MGRNSRLLDQLREVETGHSISRNDHLPPRRPSTFNDAKDDSSSLRTSFSSTSIPEETLDMYFTLESTQPKKPPRRRSVRPLAPQLLDHCTVCFEEALFSQGLSLLSSALTAGAKTDTPASLPPPQYLAIAATVSVHPMLTTRTNSKDDHASADQALRYLREVAESVVVDNSGLREAFQFENINTSTRNDRSKRARTRKSDGTGVSEEEDAISGTIRSAYAGQRSLWANAENFWAVVGWAFNCSVQHKARWNRWRPWLELMLDVLEHDMEKTYASNDDLEKTLLAQYLSNAGTGRGNTRRVLYAILADGGDKFKQFGEIWKNETKPPKKEKDDAQNWKKRKLDLDNGDFGDYLNDSGDEDSTKRRSRSTTAFSTRTRRSGLDSGPGSDDNADDGEDETSNAAHTGVDAFGGMDSIRLRQRCFALLTRFSRMVTKLGISESLFTNTEDLFDRFNEFLRPLSLPIFRQFIMPVKPYLTKDLQASLNVMMCSQLLGLSLSPDLLQQSEFENRYAPLCAINTSATDNAKVSLLIESLLRGLWRGDWLKEDTDRLMKQIEKGIEARDKKVSMDGKKKTAKSMGLDDEARKTLKASGDRMRVLVGVVAS